MPTTQRRSAALLCDLDGVVYEDERLVAGAPEAMAWVRAARIEYAFVTNTTAVSRATLAGKLERFGIPTPAERIITPAVIAARWLCAQAPGPAALFVPEDTRADFEGVPQLADEELANLRSVVIGELGEAWDFKTLNRAFGCLMAAPEAAFVALGKSRYWRAGDGLRLDTGPFVAALEHATGRRAHVLGKPTVEFFLEAAARLACAPAQAVMVGDDILTDVSAAQAAGMRGVLVRTGKFRDADLRREVRPDGVLGSIADLPDWWLAHVGTPAA